MTTLMELVRDRLGEDPVDWIRARRSARLSWDLVAVELFEATGRRRWVTPETLRVWAAAKSSPDPTATSE